MPRPRNRTLRGLARKTVLSNSCVEHANAISLLDQWARLATLRVWSWRHELQHQAPFGGNGFGEAGVAPEVAAAGAQESCLSVADREGCVKETQEWASAIG
jgi:hypothetical protein